MKHLITAILLGLVLSTTELFGQETKVNFIIQLNDQLVVGDIADLRMYIETNQHKFNIEVNYWPGDLILSEQATRILRQDSIKSATLMFDLYSYKGDKREVLNVKTSFSKFLMEQPYVILNVYDLRDKTYKRQLGHLTQDNYISEYIVQNGGRLARRR
jgi:hypothetical protein